MASEQDAAIAALRAEVERLRKVLERLIEVAQRQWDEKPSKASDIRRINEARAVLAQDAQPESAPAPAADATTIAALGAEVKAALAAIERTCRANAVTAERGEHHAIDRGMHAYRQGMKEAWRQAADLVRQAGRRLPMASEVAG